MFWRNRTTPEPAVDATPAVLRLGAAGNSAASRATLAHALLCDGQYAAALAELEVALADNPELSDGQLAKGFALARQLRFQEAIEPLQIALESGDQSRLAAFGLAAVYLRLQDYDSALNLSQRLLASDDQDAKVHSLQGEILHSQQRPADAIQSFRTAAQLNPQLLVARRRLGELLAANSEFEEACGELHAAAYLAPTDVQLLQSLAGVLHRLGKNDEAVQRYQQAIEYGRPSAELLSAIAECRLEQKRLFEAYSAARAAVTLNPRSAVAHRLLAKIYTQQGRPEAARQHEAAADRILGGAAIVEVSLTPAVVTQSPSAHIN